MYRGPRRRAKHANVASIRTTQGKRLASNAHKVNIRTTRGKRLASNHMPRVNSAEGADAQMGGAHATRHASGQLAASATRNAPRDISAPGTMHCASNIRCEIMPSRPIHRCVACRREGERERERERVDRARSLVVFLCHLCSRLPCQPRGGPEGPAELTSKQFTL
jgi:hypothetical protein